MGFRIVERQVVTYEYNATSTRENAELLEQLINRTKPEPYHAEWHDLIATPFRYPLPVPLNFAARFRSPNSMTNVLYSSKEEVTAYYEHAYYFLRFRLGLKNVRRTGQRTIFGIKILNPDDVTDISAHPDISEIIDTNDYSASYRYVEKNPNVKVICYPSCRDPERRHNFAVRDINALDKKILFERTISFSYDNTDHSMEWIDTGLRISASTFGLAPESRERSKRSVNKSKKNLRTETF